MRLTLFLVLMGLIGIQTDLFAQVYRSEGGAGGAVILPYWTTTGGSGNYEGSNDTLLSVRNDSNRATVAKLHWLDEQGNVLQSFNLYLAANSVWAVAIFSSTRPDLGPIILWFQPESNCVLPSEVFLDHPDLFYLGYKYTPLSSPRGSLEIIEMATVEEPSELAVDGLWSDCETLAARFADGGPWQADPNAGMAAPSQRLSASASIINVGLGGMNTIPASAVGGFSDVAQHTAPESSAPDLRHAFDSAAPSGGVRSTVCHATGCRTDEWAEPIEAVAAALMATSLKVDYNIEARLGAKFEWIIHRPLKRYEGSVSGFMVGSAPTVIKRLRSGIPAGFFLPEDSATIPEMPPQPFPRGTFEFPVTGGAVHQVLTVDEISGSIGDAFESPILAHLGEKSWSNKPFGEQGLASEPDSGSVELLFGDHDQPLVAADGAQYLGEPVIGFAIQQFTNGVLPGNLLANYRGTELPRRYLIVADPE